VIEYIKHPPSVDQLAALYREAGMRPAEGLRLRGTGAEERGLTKGDDDAVLAAMAAEPVLIERPLVRTEKGVRLCRPKEKVQEIL
jgi:arsenate reductase